MSQSQEYRGVILSKPRNFIEKTFVIKQFAFVKII